MRPGPMEMPIADYLALPALGSHTIAAALRSAAHARQAMVPEPDAGKSPALLFGAALHCAVLEPDRFDAQYAVFDGDLRTKDAKERWVYLEECGKTIIRRAQYDELIPLAAAIRSHPTVQELWREGGVTEHVVLWDHDGMPMKCRPDWWHPNRGVVLDIKTTTDASERAFSRACAAYGYHIQAHHYLTGTDAERFIHIACEKEPPYAVAVYELDALSLAVGGEQWRRGIEVIREAQVSGRWTGYPEGVQQLSLPAWMLNDLGE